MSGSERCIARRGCISTRPRKHPLPYPSPYQETGEGGCLSPPPLFDTGED
jgi:hypothetical protein